MTVNLLRPPTFALVASLALLSVGVITGGLLTVFQDSIYAAARREIIKRPEVHRFAGTEIIDQARTHGIKVIGCTLTPFEGANSFREEGETMRQAVNRWIRTSGAYDGVVDFDAAVRDPANPRRIKAAFDPGDHLHPNDAGYRAMAEAIDLRLFRR